MEFTAEGKAKLNYRIVGVAVKDGKVLLHRLQEDDFWTLPGGHVEFFESSLDTIKREMEGELDVEIRIERLIWIVEEFYEHKDKACHEMVFYYLLSFPGDHEIYSHKEGFYGIEQDKKLIFRWFDIEKLESLTLYPSFLKSRLKSIPGGIEHIVHREQQEQ